MTFGEELLAVSPGARDEWVDRRFGLEELPDDGPSLPPACVPYLPSPVDVVLRTIAEADVRESDVFVDIGMGVGRTGALVQLLTGATVVGLEIQPELVAAARELAARLGLERMTCVEGDAPELASHLASGTVFFLYCPFGGERLERMVDALEAVAAVRPIRICCVDLPLPSRPWLTPAPLLAGDLTIYRATADPR